MIKLDINDHVRIRLTPHGRAYLAAEHAMFNAKTGRNFPYRPPKETEDGWSTWQVHYLMHAFGSEMYLGNASLPFETQIELPGTARQQVGWLTKTGTVAQCDDPEAAKKYGWHPVWVDVSAKEGART